MPTEETAMPFSLSRRHLRQFALGFRFDPVEKAGSPVITEGRCGVQTLCRAASADIRHCIRLGIVVVAGEGTVSKR